MKKSKELLGGQALIEGVMMKGPEAVGYAVYAPDGELQVEQRTYRPWRLKFPILGLVFIRGFCNLIEMLFLGVAALDYSAKIAMPEEYKTQSKYEMQISLLISLAVSFGLFIFLPAFSFSKMQPLIGNVIYLNLLEGALRIGIFVLFLFLVGLSKDMARVFGYHGAEHMTVHAYEADEELTVENVRKYSPLHPRCGTSFLLVVFIVSVIMLSFFGRTALMSRLLIKILMLPVIAGISYELIRLVCRLPKFIAYIVLGPGLLLQFLTTRRPDDNMLKAAIAALNAAKDVD